MCKIQLYADFTLSLRSRKFDFSCCVDEHNAERTAGTLESRQLVLKSVDRDCDLREQHFSRGNPKEDEAVSQIINDLLSNKVFTKTPGREGYETFPYFTLMEKIYKPDFAVYTIE